MHQLLPTIPHTVANVRPETSPKKERVKSNPPFTPTATLTVIRSGQDLPELHRFARAALSQIDRLAQRWCLRNQSTSSERFSDADSFLAGPASDSAMQSAFPAGPASNSAMQTRFQQVQRAIQHGDPAYFHRARLLSIIRRIDWYG